MKLVNNMGSIYKMSNRNYQELLRRRAQGEWMNPAELGKFLGLIDLDYTDLDTEEARCILENGNGSHGNQ